MTNEMKTIRVMGRGFAQQAPDQIEMSLRFETLNQDYATMFQDATKKIQRLQEALQEVGFVESDLKTSSFDVGTKNESYQDQQGNWQQRFAGYQLTQAVELVFPLEMSRLGAVIAAVDQAGGQPDLRLAFTLADPTAFQRRLLEKATQDAKSKGEILAMASGKRLGELLTIDYHWHQGALTSETSLNPRSYGSGMLLAKAAMPDIQPKDIQQEDTATFVWALL